MIVWCSVDVWGDWPLSGLQFHPCVKVEHWVLLLAPYVWCLTSCFEVVSCLRTKPATGVKNELVLWRLMSKKHWLKLLIKAVLPVVSVIINLHVKKLKENYFSRTTWCDVTEIWLAAWPASSRELLKPFLALWQASQCNWGRLSICHQRLSREAHVELWFLHWQKYIFSVACGWICSCTDLLPRLPRKTVCLGFVLCS